MNNIQRFVREYYTLLSGLLAVVAVIILVISGFVNSKKNQDPFAASCQLEKSKVIFEYETPIPLGNNRLEITVYSKHDWDITSSVPIEFPFASIPFHILNEKFDAKWRFITWDSNLNTSDLQSFDPVFSHPLRKGIDENTTKEIDHYLKYAQQSLLENSWYACYFRDKKGEKKDYLLSIFDLENNIFLKIKRTNLHPTIQN